MEIEILHVAQSCSEFLRGGLLQENNLSLNSADLTEMETPAKTFRATVDWSNADWKPTAIVAFKMVDRQ